MSMGRLNEPAGSPRIVADAVCTSCSCLCDDIELEIDGDRRLIEARNACPLGRAGLLRDRPHDGPACLIDGQPATIEEGVDHAARILAEAGSPLIAGLGETTAEAQRAAVSLAGWIGACVDFPGGEATVDALQSIGEVTCTLGEIKNRADLIVVWRADPVETHPRLFTRYALDPVGTFLPGGRSDRFCAIVDVRETTSFPAADQPIRIKEDGEVDALWALRALAKGVALDADSVESTTGISLASWQGLMERMKAARYGAIFYGPGAETSGSGVLIARGIHSLTRDLNAMTRFVCLPLPSGGNRVGARNVLGWQTGYPGAVSFASGYPRFGPGEFDARALIERREVDAALIVSGGSIPQIPCIVLTSGDLTASEGAAVVFRTAAFGIETTGTAYRMDGVPLPLRAAVASPFPSDEDVLRAIERRVRSLAMAKPAGAGRP